MSWRTQQRRNAVRLACFAAALLVLAAARPGDADVIVLKNGQRITAEQVTESGDQVTYEGSAGRVSLPKSAVERVESDGPAEPDQSGSATGSLQPDDQPDVQITPGDLRPEDIVRGGAVNEQLLAELGSQAGQGPQQQKRAFNAFLMAAAFETTQKRFGEASRWAEAAVQLYPTDRNALLLAAYIDLNRRQFREALGHLLVLQNLDPSSPEVLAMLGDAYYFSDGPSRALLYWKQADALHPDPRLAERIRQVEQEAAIEPNQQQVQSYHFALSWEGSAASAGFGRDVLELLERQFSDLETALGFTPNERVDVVLYSSVQFADITHAPSWAGAANDGKIRVPVQGLTSISAELTRVLKHELTHSFIYQQTEGRCPTWLNEGLAELESGDQLASYGPDLARLAADSQLPPLQQLQGSFEAFNETEARLAYGESLAAVEWIRDRRGEFELPELLRAMSNSTSEEALHNVVGVDYEELDRQVSTYLQESYRQ